MCATHAFEDTVGIDTGKADIYGTLIIPHEAWGAVIFAQGSGSSRHNPRHISVAETFHHVGLATLLVDLLTPAEERVDQFTAQYRFHFELLTDRLIAATPSSRVSAQMAGRAIAAIERRKAGR